MSATFIPFVWSFDRAKVKCQQTRSRSRSRSGARNRNRSRNRTTTTPRPCLLGLMLGPAKVVLWWWLYRARISLKTSHLFYRYDKSFELLMKWNKIRNARVMMNYSGKFLGSKKTHTKQPKNKLSTWILFVSKMCRRSLSMKRAGFRWKENKLFKNFPIF